VEPPAQPHRPLTFFNWVRSEESFSREACDWIVALGSSSQANLGGVGDGKLGGGRLAERRQSFVHRIHADERTAAFHSQLEGLAYRINDRHYGLEIDGIVPPDYIEYHAGFGHFDWHNDYAYLSAERARKLTLIVQLSDPADYEGGQLEVFDTEPSPLPRERGAVVAFPTFVPHRVTPVTRGVRRSLILWATGPTFR
jgi:PKHD-type hydroxylase